MRPFLAIGAAAAMLPAGAGAADFSTSFEGRSVRTAACFAVASGGLSARFTGGTAFTIGNGALYRTGSVSWMLDPAGSSVRGTSTGEATADLSEPARAVTAYVRNETPQTLARLQFIDTQGSVVKEMAATSAQWTEVTHTTLQGAPGIDRLVLLNDGASGMTALDDLSFSTDAAPAAGPVSCGGGGGGGGGGAARPWLLAALALFALRRRPRR